MGSTLCPFPNESFVGEKARERRASGRDWGRHSGERNRWHHRLDHYLESGGVGSPVSGLGRTARSRDKEETVGETARNLGKELLTFAQGRHAQHRAGSARAFDADTMSLFHELFGDRVVQVIDKLRDTGRIGVREAQVLIAPSRPVGIEQLGRRLIELGYPESKPAGT